MPAVSSVAGICAAAFAWMQAVRTARLTAYTQLRIEEAKLDADRKRRAYEIAKADATTLEEALDHAWRNIQNIKEALAKLGRTGLEDQQVIIERLQDAAQALAGGYADVGSQLSERARSAWHSAKAAGATAVNYALTSATTPIDESTIAEIRMSLTDRQSTLAIERSSLRLRLASQQLEML